MLKLFILLLFLSNLSLCRWDQHHDNFELHESLMNVSKKCPEITYLYSLKFGHLNQTILGNKLWVLAMGVSPQSHTPGIPEFKYVANMHGNEVVGRELLLRLASELCDGYINNNKDIRWFLEHTRIHLMPSMNPDGWQLAIGEGKNQLTGRANANNVDLNRNFPDLDAIVFKKHSLGEVEDHLLKPQDLLKEKLEPETWLVVNWLIKTPFVLSANMHGGDLVANYPYDDSRTKASEYSACPDDKLFRLLAESYSISNDRMFDGIKKCDITDKKFKDGITNGADWYPVNRGLQDFNYLATNCFEITLELGCTKYPKAETLPAYWEQNRDSLFQYMAQVHGGVKGMVYGYSADKDDIIPIPEARIKVAEINGDSINLIRHNVWSNGDGDFYRLLAPGEYTISVESDGYSDAIGCLRINGMPQFGDNMEAQKLIFVLKPMKSDGPLVSADDLIEMATNKGHDAEHVRVTGGLNDLNCAILVN